MGSLWTASTGFQSSGHAKQVPTSAGLHSPIPCQESSPLLLGGELVLPTNRHTGISEYTARVKHDRVGPQVAVRPLYPFNIQSHCIADIWLYTARRHQSLAMDILRQSVVYSVSTVRLGQA